MHEANNRDEMRAVLRALQTARGRSNTTVPVPETPEGLHREMQERANHIVRHLDINCVSNPAFQQALGPHLLAEIDQWREASNRFHAAEETVVTDEAALVGPRM